MLPFDFDYFKPSSLQEALEIYQTMENEGKQPMYISGGTELITLGRIDIVYSEAVIDLKDIAECRAMQMSGEHLILGSALILTQIEEANLFPLLTQTTSEIADHTARGKITLGGNICGQIFYREAVLPFLLADSLFVTVGPQGVKVLPGSEIFNETLLLNKGEFLVQIATEKRFLGMPFVSIKRRQQWQTGYPLITIASLKIENRIRVAISGLCPFPFRSHSLESVINNRELPQAERINQVLKELQGPILDDVEGSADYRRFVLRNLLFDVLAELDRGE